MAAYGDTVFSKRVIARNGIFLPNGSFLSFNQDADAATSRAGLGVTELEPAWYCATSNVASLSGAATVDGHNLVAGDRVLLVAQTTAAQNGPWQVNAGAWTRPADYASGMVISKPRVIAVVAGANYAGSIWMLALPAGVTVDTTATAWTPTMQAALPWQVPLELFTGTHAARVGTWTQAYVAHIGAGVAWNSSGALNDSISWDVMLAAGTWKLGILSAVQNNAGIVTLQLDGAAVGGTVDLYNAAQTYDTLNAISPFTVPVAGKHRITLIAAGKNGTSTAYQLPLQKLTLQRTA